MRWNQGLIGKVLASPETDCKVSMHKKDYTSQSSETGYFCDGRRMGKGMADERQRS